MNGRKLLINVELIFLFFPSFVFIALPFLPWLLLLLLNCCCYFSLYFCIIVLVVPKMPQTISSPPYPHPHPPPLLLYSLACFKVGGGNEVFGRRLIWLESPGVSLPELLSGVSAESLGVMSWYIHYPEWQVEFLFYWRLIPLPLALPLLGLR